MRKECQYYDDCSAPLCPLDPESLKHGIWYPDEEICQKRSVPDWVKVQRRIAKKTSDVDKYFTFEMLARVYKVTQGIVGLDPDKEEKPQLKRWLEKHPPKSSVKKELTEEEKAVLRERLKKAHEARKRKNEKSTSKK